MTFCGLDTVLGAGEVGVGRTDETAELSLAEETHELKPTGGFDGSEYPEEARPVCQQVQGRGRLRYTGSQEGLSEELTLL